MGLGGAEPLAGVGRRQRGAAAVLCIGLCVGALRLWWEPGCYKVVRSGCPTQTWVMQVLLAQPLVGTGEDSLLPLSCFAFKLFNELLKCLDCLAWNLSRLHRPYAAQCDSHTSITNSVLILE